MSAKRDLHEETIKQCTEFFTRELSHYNRLLVKRIEISNEELHAKELIIEAVFQIGSAAVMRTGRRDHMDTYNFNYGELRMALEEYRRRFLTR
ncbi:hypothetical protein RP20_CCG005942 [Aedes albopictus]|nr:hypothetical protein RP20_CCG005942 [Aedes albopictus]